MITEGTPAPEFTLKDQDGEDVSLLQFRGKKVVLYFYPKDDTPGCTKEACNFRDINSEIIAKGGVVLGVSGDSPESHTKFRLKFNLPFHLLSDPDHAVIKAYDAWKQKMMFGNSFMGIVRSTYIIDEKGIIIKVFPKVSPDQHAQQVLDML